LLIRADPTRSSATSLHLGRSKNQGSCFVVCDHNGQPLAYVYYDHPQAGDLTWDEARRIAANIANLTED
jgi:hypothetical protein